MRFFDSHIHLARLPEPLEVASMLHGRGYRYRAVACEPWEWKAAQELREKASAEGWLEGCAFSFGVHPMIAAQVAEGSVDGGPEDLWEELRKLLESDPNAQVGEAGLDKRYPGYEPGGVQEKQFCRQAELALELGRDLQIHCVGDYGRVVAILRDVGFTCARAGVTSGSRPVFHRFGGDCGVVKLGLQMGALFSIHADSFRKKATRDALALIPREHLLFETDADETFCQMHALNASATSRDVAEMLATTLEKTMSEI